MSPGAGLRLDKALAGVAAASGNLLSAAAVAVVVGVCVPLVIEHGPAVLVLAAAPLLPLVGPSLILRRGASSIAGGSLGVGLICTLGIILAVALPLSIDRTPYLGQPIYRFEFVDPDGSVVGFNSYRPAPWDWIRLSAAAVASVASIGIVAATANAAWRMRAGHWRLVAAAAVLALVVGVPTREAVESRSAGLDELEHACARAAGRAATSEPPGACT